MSELKIFKMNEYDWWVDYDLKSAIGNYSKYGKEEILLDDDDIKVGEARQITVDELNTLLFDDVGEGRKVTFRDALQGIDKPQFFASTEW